MIRYFLITLFSVICLEGFSIEKALTREQYIQSWKDEAIYQMVIHKIPASITLAQGILESGDGNSRLAKDGNNHFGIKCHSDWSGERIFEDDETKGECFRSYSNAKESFEDHSAFLLRKRYESLFKLDIDDYKGWAHGLKNCGYATNPKYPQLLIKIIEEFNLTAFDKEGIAYIKKKSIPARSDNASVEPNITAETGKQKRSGGKSKNDASEGRMTISINGNREIATSENKIKFVKAKGGDSIESIARDLDLNAWLINKYNDFEKDEVIREGQIIYIQPKRNRCSDEFHVVKSGDSLKSISQLYGIKLKKLMKYNRIENAADLKAGAKLKLRK